MRISDWSSDVCSSDLETTVGVSIPIELGGKRSARIAVADARTTRAQLAAAITEADIRLQVTQLYIDAVAAERRLTTALDQTRIANHALNGARVRVRAGRAAPIEEQTGRASGREGVCQYV